MFKHLKKWPQKWKQTLFNLGWQTLIPFFPCLADFKLFPWSNRTFFLFGTNKNLAWSENNQMRPSQLALFCRKKSILLLDNHPKWTLFIVLNLPLLSYKNRLSKFIQSGPRGRLYENQVLACRNGNPGSFFQNLFSTQSMHLHYKQENMMFIYVKLTTSPYPLVDHWTKSVNRLWWTCVYQSCLYSALGSTIWHQKFASLTLGCD